MSEVGDFFLTHFLGRALLGLIGLSVISGALGCIFVWRRLVFLSDSLGHSALLGIVLGLGLDIPILLPVLLLCAGVGLFLSYGRRLSLTPDIWLAVLSYTFLSLGILGLSLIPGVRVDPFSLLFGDILAVTPRDLIWIYGIGVSLAGILWGIWRSVLMVSIDWDLAYSSGMKVQVMETITFIALALTVAIGLKIVGILLLPPLLIFPALMARPWALTPESMVGGACLLGLIGALIGFGGSLRLDLPTGPCIVVGQALLLGGSYLLSALKR